MTRWTTRRAVLGCVVLAVLAVGAAACSSGSESGGSASATSAATAPASPEIGLGDSVASAARPGATAPDASGNTEQVPVGGVARSLVRTAELSVEVPDLVPGARDVRAAAAAAGGVVTEEQSGRYRSSIVVRVPSDALDGLVDRVSELGEVTQRSAGVVDVTEDVVDLDARVTSQQASVARIRTLLAEATSIGDVVSIESELARREAELDSLTGRLTALRDQVALSTLSVELRGPDAADREPDVVGFGGGLAAGWSGLLALGSGLGAVLGFVLPFLPVLALLLGVGWLLRRRRAARKAARPPAPASP